MKVGDHVQVYSGHLTGYYGKVLEVGDTQLNDGHVLVSHDEGFAGHWVSIADTVEPVHVTVTEND